MNRQRKGFTLIELLIATAIFGVVSIAVYSTFSSGMRIWQRAKEINIVQEKLLLKTEKLSQELRQTFNFKDIAFYGTEDKIYFPSIINSEISGVTYLFDADKKIFFRGTSRLTDILAAEKNRELPEPKLFSYLSNINKLSFSYFYFDTQKAAYLWKDAWEDNNLPLAVKLDITTNNETYTTTIFIPAP